MLPRYAYNQVLDLLKPNKVVILIGPRRVGKTTLLNEIKRNHTEEILFLNGDDQNVTQILENRSIENYTKLLGTCKFLIIDEAQEIIEIGKRLKLMIDSIEGLKIIASGSSAFNLTKNTGEPLVGRAYTINLLPIGQVEISRIENLVETRGALEERLIFGSYPEIFSLESYQEKSKYLAEMINSYLLKDILAFEGIQKSQKILSLLKILAFRVGNEISNEAIGNELGISKNTVERYLDLLSKVFIVFQVTGFSRNLDNEITKKSKWYFFDNGIRNALINNFNLLPLRDDVGKLWENYLLYERIKKIQSDSRLVNYFFWRTHTKQEIDWIEEENGKISAYEIKWKETKKVKIPDLWRKNYSNASFEVINQSNYLNFIT